MRRVTPPPQEADDLWSEPAPSRWLRRDTEEDEPVSPSSERTVL